MKMPLQFVFAMLPWSIVRPLSRAGVFQPTNHHFAVETLDKHNNPFISGISFTNKTKNGKSTSQI